MTRPAAVVAFVVLAGLTAGAHDFGVSITWNREISRLVFERCASCHREGGTSFSLMTYQDVQPRAVAIKDAVLSRRMPPWGAVKGFGEFRNDQGLTQEQVELVAAWVEGGASRGNNRRILPDPPTSFETPPAPRVSAGSLTAGADFTLARPFALDGLLPQGVRRDATMRVTAVLPDGTVKPLVWLYEYDERFKHLFLLRSPLALPAGTVIRGVRPPARLELLPALHDKNGKGR